MATNNFITCNQFNLLATNNQPTTIDEEEEEEEEPFACSHFMLDRSNMFEHEE
jgi:hypothetical protein